MIKTYTVDLSKPKTSELANSIIAEVMESDNMLKHAQNNLALVKNETLKILKDIVDSINPSLEPLDLKIHLRQHFWHRNNEMLTKITLTDPHRACYGRGIHIQITNPSVESFINQTQVYLTDFKPKIVVIRNMSEFGHNEIYSYVSAEHFLENERDNIKKMYLVKKRHNEELVK